MPPKSKAKAAPKSDADDELAFLEAVAVQSKARREATQRQQAIPDSVFADLPSPTSPSQRDFIPYNEHAGHRTFDRHKLDELTDARDDLREAGLIHEQVKT
jgi:hypothetical protein